mmetsp:Transcript_5272/g.17506  ORF Transcript_5272/g.17506 Transcript_5272/m.17506 type:complete len:111 (-) Transcript_5272:201-533(-)
MLRQGEAADGEVEVAVWRLLWHAAARYLLQLPTTAKHDEALLQSWALPEASGGGGRGRGSSEPAEVAPPCGDERLKLSVEWRVQHKRLLQRAVRYAEGCLAILGEQPMAK